MIPTLIRRNAAAATKAAFDIKNNPYKAKRTWPPDFTQLSQKHQFRMERRYRRRAKLKWARPQWTKFVKLAQWGSILFVLGYGIFFMEVPVGEEGASPTPFDGLRAWYKGLTGSVWSQDASQPIPESPQNPEVTEKH